MSLFTIEELTDICEKIGSGNADPSQYGGIHKENGYFLMQYYKEYAEYLFFMINNFPEGFNNTVCIGMGAGGECRLFRDLIRCQHTICIDNGTFDLYARWPKNKPHVNSLIIADMLADSKHQSVRDWLDQHQMMGTIDHAFIDGAHEEENVIADFNLIKSYAQPGCIIVLHDTHLIPQCRTAKDKIKTQEHVEEIFGTYQRHGITVLRLNSVA